MQASAPRGCHRAVDAPSGSSPGTPSPVARLRRAARQATAAVALLSSLVLAACGGGAGSGPVTPAAQDKPATREEAARFLTQAAFGVTEPDIDRVMSLGYSAWIDEQLDPGRRPQARLVDYWNTADARIKGVDATAKAGPREVLEGFYQNAVFGNTQLRDRLAFALSQIFVISTLDGVLSDNARLVASYYDMLASRGTGSFRSLLEGVALHPAMGVYLSHIRNEKENNKGRVPDQNFAREVMQLFSIGLYKLNLDGTVQTDANGKPLETYSADDIKGLSYVFTGFSFAGPDKADQRFYGFDRNYIAPDRDVLPMQAYPKFHSLAEKKFLGVTIPARSGTVDAAGGAEADLKIALDTLANHPSTAPFISRQLIQRFITSNPSAEYVARVATAFRNSGGNMTTVLKAVLLDAEAREPARLSSVGAGKLREPVLRMTALMRAFGAQSDSGRFTMDQTDDGGTSLGQTPLRAPSVFNYYRPGYTPPNTRMAAQALVAPEMQLVNETTVAGYANFVMNGLQQGFGLWQKNAAGATRPDVQLAFTDRATAAEFATSELRPLAEKPADLADLINRRLLYGRMTANLRQELLAAVEAITIPALKPDNSNATAVDTARRRRIMTAIFLAAVSPDFLIQQ